MYFIGIGEERKPRAIVRKIKKARVDSLPYLQSEQVDNPGI